MFTVLFILIFIIIIVAIIGLIKPSLILRWGPETKRNRKYVLLYGLIGIIICFVGMGVSGPPLSKNKTEKSDNIDEQKKAPITEENKSDQKTHPSIPDKLCLSAGIGDTMNTWKQDYGDPNRDNGTLKSFNDDKFLVVVADNRIINITIQELPYTHPSVDDVVNFLPQDRKGLQTRIDNTDSKDVKYITVGESESLKAAVPNSNGKFIVIMRSFSDSHKNSAVIGIGDKP